MTFLRAAIVPRARTLAPYPGLGRALLFAGLLCPYVSACGKKAPEAPEAPPTASATRGTVARDTGDRGRTVESNDPARLRALLAEASDERQRLTAELAELEETNATLELELGSALEELLRSQANLRNVQSRAFAVSRIAEVRVELQTFRESDDSAISSRVERADEFLTRADGALGEGNVGGAAYLAERAGELLRQVRTVAEIRSKGPKELIPIVPPRWVEVQTQANLRAGPGTDHERVGTLAAGTKVQALAREGEWYQVRTDDGATAWIYRRLVR